MDTCWCPIRIPSASFCNSIFQRRTRVPSLPPPSAAMSGRLAPGYTGCPIDCHQPRMLSTAKTAVPRSTSETAFPTSGHAALFRTRLERRDNRNPVRSYRYDLGSPYLPRQVSRELPSEPRRECNPCCLECQGEAGKAEMLSRFVLPHRMGPANLHRSRAFRASTAGADSGRPTSVVRPPAHLQKVRGDDVRSPPLPTPAGSQRLPIRTSFSASK